MIELSRSKKTQLPYAPDGRKRYAINASIDVIQMKEDGGEWEDIDTTLGKDGIPTKVPYEITPYLNGLPGFHYKSKQSGEFDVRIKEARLDSISITPISPKPSVKPVIKDRTITWTDLYPDVDVVLTAFNTGVSLNRIIKAPTAPLEYDVEITETGKGQAQLRPLQPAEDAEGQLILMEEKPTIDGRTETLKLEVVEQEGIEVKHIAYPIRDSTIIDDQPPAAGTDDGYQCEGTGVMNNDSNLLKARSNSATNNRYWILMRWEVDIDQSSTIDVAYFNSFFYMGDADSPNCEMHFEYNATPATTTTDANDITDRTITGASTPWVDTGLSVDWQESPSIVDPLQEVIDDFTVDAVALILVGNSDFDSWHFTYSWELSSHEYAPNIYIEYSEGAPAGASVSVVKQYMERLMNS